MPAASCFPPSAFADPLAAHALPASHHPASPPGTNKRKRFEDELDHRAEAKRKLYRSPTPTNAARFPSFPGPVDAEMAVDERHFQHRPLASPTSNPFPRAPQDEDTHAHRYYPDIEPYPPSSIDIHLSGCMDVDVAAPRASTTAPAQTRIVQHGPNCSSIPRLSCIPVPPFYNTTELWATCQDCGAVQKVDEAQSILNMTV